MSARNFRIGAIVVALIIAAIITCNLKPLDAGYPVNPILDHSGIRDTLGNEITVFPVDSADADK